MKKRYIALLLLAVSIPFFSCTEDKQKEPMLIVKFRFDPTQERLNNLGQPTAVSAGNAAQSPIFNTISSHYIELAPNANTQLGTGEIIYRAPETTGGGDNAIDFDRAKIVAQGETFLKIPLSQVAAGSYEWMRVSLSYQNYQINVRSAGADYSGTLASFVGFNTYISSFNIGNNIFNINGNRAQGFWAFGLNDHPYSTSGQAPAGATTVPNPIEATSPIPRALNTCVVTGKFPTNLEIDGTETNDIIVTLSLSTNKSFEWREVNADGKYEPAAGENVVDMGLRGLIPTFTK